VLQHVTVNGFTEADAFSSIGGFTALSFAEQTRNSAVSELGYQASIDWGRWRPFAKVVWNHELASTDRSVTERPASPVIRHSPGRLPSRTSSLMADRSASTLPCTDAVASG
jgi:uncharacterized protein with beta-barrel porin domain